MSSKKTSACVTRTARLSNSGFGSTMTHEKPSPLTTRTRGAVEFTITSKAAARAKPQLRAQHDDFRSQTSRHETRTRARACRIAHHCKWGTTMAHGRQRDSYGVDPPEPHHEQTPPKHGHPRRQGHHQLFVCRDNRTTHTSWCSVSLSFRTVHFLAAYSLEHEGTLRPQTVSSQMSMLCSRFFVLRCNSSV